MGRALQLPNETELPQGDRRVFVVQLFDYYRSARRPRLAEIEQRIQEDENLVGFASRETIRKLLTGKTIPLNWNNVDAVFRTLCNIAGIPVDETVASDERTQDDLTRAAHLELLWNRAIDAPAVDRHDVASRLDSTSADVAKPTSASSALLSDREREVAELVVQGRTYKEIGETLFISAKTVEHHVARMQQRLNITGRSELHAELRRILNTPPPS